MSAFKLPQYVGEDKCSQNGLEDGAPNETPSIDFDTPVTYEIEKKMSWKTAGLIQLCDVVGVGVLGLGSTVASVGILPAVFLLLFYSVCCTYSGFILQEVFLVYRHGHSYPLMAKYVSNNNFWFKNLVRLLFYLFILLNLAQYVNLLSASVQALFINLKLCSYLYGLVALVMVLPLNQLRTLNDNRSIQVVNSLCITLVIVISVMYIWLNLHKVQRSPLQLVNPNVNFHVAISAVSQFFYALTGNIIFPQIMAEMEKPETFYKAFSISVPYQVVMYALASISQYAYYGPELSQKSILIFEAIPMDNPLYGTCAFLLLIHVMCTYLINATIVARVWHFQLDKESVNSKNVKGSAVWFGCTVLVAIFAWMVSSSIPNFLTMMDFVSALVASPCGFILPVVFLLLTRRNTDRSTKEWEWFVLTFLVILALFQMIAGLYSFFAFPNTYGGKGAFQC